MSKSKKLSRVELDVVVNEILKKSKEVKVKKIEEKYSKEIKLIDKELDLIRKNYLKLKEDFEIKKEKLSKLLDKNEIVILVRYINDIEEYKREDSWKKKYYGVDLNDINVYDKIRNELILEGIDENINIKEVINNYVNKLVK
jgi:hypothetical protein